MLKGKTALVTGSTSGIGLGIARALARQGANVVLNGFGDVAGPKAEIAALGVRAGYHGADMSKPAEIEAMLAYAASEFGGVDVLVNNAGIQHVAAIEDFPVEKWDAIIAINLSSTFHTTRLALRGMRAKNWGRIVNVASITMYGGWALLSPYVASKGALVGLARAWAREFGPYGVTVNAVAPGAFPTDAEKIHPDPAGYARFVLEHQAIKRRGTPSDFASALIFLTSDEAGFITGQTLDINGGWVMH